MAIIKSEQLYLSSSQIYVGSGGDRAQGIAMNGDVNIDSLGTTTIQDHTVTYVKMQQVTQKSVLGNMDPAGGFVQEIPIVDAYLPAGPDTVLLENTSNWDINGNYTGTPLSGTYQGQNHYNANYFFTAVADDVWIRLIRG